MPAARTQRFIEALHALEARGAVEALAGLFGETAVLSNLTTTESGPDAARKFWQRYRGQFAELRSDFSRTIESGDDAVLVWRTRGRLESGAPIDYRGVSLLTFAGDAVVAFDTCYDSAAFMQPQVEAQPEPQPEAGATTA